MLCIQGIQANLMYVEIIVMHTGFAPSCPTILKKRFLLQDTFADKISHSQEPECDYPSVIMGIPIRNTYVTVDLYAYPSLSYII